MNAEGKASRPGGAITADRCWRDTSEWLRCRRLAVLRRARGTEKVDEQLRDALSLVVMDPVRRVGKALDTVEVGYVIVFGLGEFGAEVAIALAPNDECGRRDWAQRRFGGLRRLPHRRPVIVDHPRCCALLRPRLDIAIDLLRR